MKTLILISLLSSIAYADNCYVLDKGSSAWVDCKEEAAHNERERDRIDARYQANDAQAAADSMASAQASADMLFMRLAMQEQKNAYQEKK